MAREFGTGHGATSVIFALTAFGFFTLGAVSGPVADRVGPRRVVLAGALAMGAGLALTAFVPSIWLGYVTYGLGVGVGTACGYVPMVAAVGGWFQRGRAFAIGLAVSGIGVGTLAVPPLAAVAIGPLGWRRTYLGFAAASFVILAVCALLAARPPAAAGTPVRLGRAVRTRGFVLLYASGLVSSFSLFLAVVHIVPYAVALGAGPVAAAALISIVGAAALPGGSSWAARRSAWARCGRSSCRSGSCCSAM